MAEDTAPSIRIPGCPICYGPTMDQFVIGLVLADNQVRRDVVGPVLVDVMNHGLLRKRLPEDPFGHQHVLTADPASYSALDHDPDITMTRGTTGPTAAPRMAHDKTHRLAFDVAIEAMVGLGNRRRLPAPAFTQLGHERNRSTIAHRRAEAAAISASSFRT